MITAMVDNNRVLPSPKMMGICPYCNTPVRSKCGSINIWHFAHLNLQESCDYWKEHESEWHREWKSWFPLENTEVIKIKDDEKHIADIHLDTFIFELQNSPMPYDERLIREQFWGTRLRWIVKSDFKRFKLLLFERDPLGSTLYNGKKPHVCFSFYGEQFGQSVGSEKLPIIWVWKHPKKWITYNPPQNFYIDLTGSNYILSVNKVIENNFGFGSLIDRPTFITNLKNFHLNCGVSA